jgi:HK97 family phage prohead protease
MDYIQLEFKELTTNDNGYFEGYAAIFGNVDLKGDIIDSKAFDNTLEQFKAEGTLPHLFFQHNPNIVVGEYTDMKIDSKGLKVEGVLWVANNKLGRDAVESAGVARNILKSKARKGLSIGFITKDSEWTQKNGNDVRILKEIDLHEVSVVSGPANPQAKVINVKSDLDAINKREIENTLKLFGLSVKQSKKFVAAGLDSLNVCDEQEEADEVVQDEQKSDNLKQMLEEIKSINQTYNIGEK